MHHNESLCLISGKKKATMLMSTISTATTAHGLLTVAAAGVVGAGLWSLETAVDGAGVPLLRGAELLRGAFADGAVAFAVGTGVAMERFQPGHSQDDVSEHGCDDSGRHCAYFVPRRKKHPYLLSSMDW